MTTSYYPTIWLTDLTDEDKTRTDELLNEFAENDTCEDMVDCFDGKYGLLIPALISTAFASLDEFKEMTIDQIMDAVIKNYGGTVKMIESRHKYTPLDNLTKLGMVEKHRKPNGRVSYSITAKGYRCAACIIRNSRPQIK